MYARVTTYPRTALRDARERCEASNVTALPLVASLPGCRGTLVLSDPMTGQVQTLSFWDSDDTLIAANDVQRKVSHEVVKDAGLCTTGFRTEIYEVVASEFTLVA